MSKSKVNLDIEQEHLASAKSFVARHGGSLNELVTDYFASLGRDEASFPAIVDPAMQVLLDVSNGKISAVHAAIELGLPDAGFVLQKILDANLPLPKLPDDVVQRQAALALDALRGCLIVRKVEPGKDVDCEARPVHA